MPGKFSTFLLAPFAGVLVDRLDRRKILVWTQTLAAVQSLALAVLTLAKVITVHEVLWLSVLQGLINAFDMPGRQSFLVQMVEDKKGSGQRHRAQFFHGQYCAAGRSGVGGDRNRVVGEGYCFLIDGISYLAVIASLLMMRVTIAASLPSKASMLQQLKDGWTYVTGFPPVRTILSLFASISLMGMPFMVLMPIFAAQVLHGGPHTLGFLLGASGVGALISAVSLALRKTVRGLTTMIQLSAALFGLGLIGFGLSRFFPLSLLLMLIVGFGMMQGMAASNTVIQTLVRDDKRGRVMSFYTMAFMGMAPFGSLLAGSLAHRLGAPHAVMITGAFCVAGSIWFTTQLKSIRQAMRPIYIELGIIRSNLEPAMEDQVGR